MSDYVEWLPAEPNDDGIDKIAFVEDYPGLRRIVGYDGILKGDKVSYKNKEYTVVMVSRLGHLGLSETGELPYTTVTKPSEVMSVK